MPGMSTSTAKRTRPGSRRARSDQAPPAAGVADALFSAIGRRLLDVFVAHPGCSYSAAELIGLVSEGAAAVRRELRRLAESGVVVAARVGRQNRYQANRDAVALDALRARVTETVGVVDALRRALEALGERVRLALVYGAAAGANGTATTGVIDVLLVAEDVAMEEIRAAFAGAERRLARRVNPLLYTRKEFVRRLMDGNPFLAEVLEGEYLLLVGKEADVSCSAR